MKTAIYPGSFDPLTLGHLDIIERSSRLFDRVVVAVARNSAKTPLFTVDERRKSIAAAVRRLKNVEVDAFEGLLVDYARSQKAAVIVRGVRAVADYEYELQMAQMNRRMAPGVETVFMMPAPQHSALSSTLVREIARHGGPLDGLVTPAIARQLRRKFQ